MAPLTSAALISTSHSSSVKIRSTVKIGGSMKRRRRPGVSRLMAMYRSRSRRSRSFRSAAARSATRTPGEGLSIRQPQWGKPGRHRHTTYPARQPRGTGARSAAIGRRPQRAPSRGAQSGHQSRACPECHRDRIQCRLPSKDPHPKPRCGPRLREKTTNHLLQPPPNQLIKSKWASTIHGMYSTAHIDVREGASAAPSEKLYEDAQGHVLASSHA